MTHPRPHWDFVPRTSLSGLQDGQHTVPGRPEILHPPLNRVSAGSAGSVGLPEAVGYLVPGLLGRTSGHGGPLTGSQPHRSSSGPGRMRLPGLNSCMGRHFAVAILGQGIQPPNRGGIPPRPWLGWGSPVAAGSTALPTNPFATRDLSNSCLRSPRADESLQIFPKFSSSARRALRPGHALGVLPLGSAGGGKNTCLAGRTDVNPTDGGLQA